MCFYYAITRTKTDSLVKNKVLHEEQLLLFEEKHFVNGFDHPLMPVISSESPEKIQLFHWGLVPKLTRSLEEANKFINQYSTLNAKCESILTSRLYGEVVKKKRCLVLCSGFFEWRHKEPGNPKSEKYPFYISLKNDEMFVFAGIWESFVDVASGEIIKTYSIITTEANQLMEIVHNNKKRMPVLIEHERALKWLKPDLTDDEIRSFFKPYDMTKMKARPVFKINPKLAALNNDPTVTAYYHYPELAGMLSADMFEFGTDLINN